MEKEMLAIAKLKKQRIKIIENIEKKFCLIIGHSI